MNITLTRSADLSEGKVRVCFGCGNIHDRMSWISLQTDGLDNGILRLHELPYFVRQKFRTLTDEEIRALFEEFTIPEGITIEPYSDDDSKTETWFYLTPATKDTVKLFSQAFAEWFYNGLQHCQKEHETRSLEGWLWGYAKFNGTEWVEDQA